MALGQLCDGDRLTDTSTVMHIPPSLPLLPLLPQRLGGLTPGPEQRRSRVASSQSPLAAVNLSHSHL